MPQLKSAIKRVKTSEKSHLRNISYKSKIKSSIKKFALALSEKKKEESNKYFTDSISILDKAVNKGILPKNTASRQKSSLTKKLNTLIKLEPTKESAPAAPEKVVETQEKPVVKKVKAAKAAKKLVTKKPAVSKKKTETKKTVKAKVKPVVKKAAKAAKKPATKKTETKKTKS
ncbi:30S ribosomal protein S20 [bacterium]|nr:30S ribosomal protein S20 [bacterium]